MPEVSASRPITYSFRDVVALRTCVFLRQESSLQRIRRAIGTLREMGEMEHLSTYRLVSQGDTILLLDGSAAVDLVHQPGQQVVMATLAEVFAPFDSSSGVRVPDLRRPRPHLRVDPETRSGLPVVDGTRIPYDVVAALVADGLSPSEVAEFYPQVSAAAARDAADFGQYVDAQSGRAVA